MTGLFDGFEGYRVHSDADVDTALRSALIAVDANVLLNLYRYNAQTTDDLLTIFESSAIAWSSLTRQSGSSTATGLPRSRTPTARCGTSGTLCGRIRARPSTP